MRYSEAFIPTMKEVPKDAEATSHKLMVRAGLVRRLGAGLYCYLPLGWRSLLKVIEIVRDEMDKAGAQEVLLPAIHPSELWERTGRIYELGDDMMKFKNRSDKLMVLGPTHEEVITWLVANEVRSYRQLPLNLYQIQTKFRDEPRPRFGVIRTCEFIMKDAYSFDTSWEGLDKSYQKMYKAYCRIFERCGLNYLVVEADPGVMGGDVSHEFMAESEYGEDKVLICDECGYSASRDVAERRQGEEGESLDTELDELKEVHTPGISTVEEVSSFLNVNPSQLLKTIIYKAGSEFIGALVRGDHEVNEVKLRKYLGRKDIRMATPDEIRNLTKAEVGFSGPVGLGIRLVADYDVKGMRNFVTGANKTDYHLMNVNLDRDFKVDEFADIRYVIDDDPCPRCNSGKLKSRTAIEIGHIFKLGTRYSQPLKAFFVDEGGKELPIIMGCYGIGINRIVAAYIEQNYDEKGIIWNTTLAPYQVIIICTNVAESKLSEMAEELYNYLSENGIEVLYDDRDVRAGIKFNDADLLGIPYQIIIGEKYLKEGKFELKTRDRKASYLIATKEDALRRIREIML